MKTTITKLAGISLLLTTFLAASTAAGFARPTRMKKTEIIKEQTLHLTGQVAKINKDRTFEMVGNDGQLYMVHMNENSSVGKYHPIALEKQVLNFEDLRVNMRVFFIAEQLEPTYASTSSPMPVVVR